RIVHPVAHDHRPTNTAKSRDESRDRVAPSHAADEHEVESQSFAPQRLGGEQDGQMVLARLEAADHKNGRARGPGPCPDRRSGAGWKLTLDNLGTGEPLRRQCVDESLEL